MNSNCWHLFCYISTYVIYGIDLDQKWKFDEMSVQLEVTYLKKKSRCISFGMTLVSEKSKWLSYSRPTQLEKRKKKKKKYIEIVIWFFFILRYVFMQIWWDSMQTRLQSNENDLKISDFEAWCITSSNSNIIRSNIE